MDRKRSCRPWHSIGCDSDFVRWRLWMEDFFNRNCMNEWDRVELGRLGRPRQELLYAACCSIADEASDIAMGKPEED